MKMLIAFAVLVMAASTQGFESFAFPMNMAESRIIGGKPAVSGQIPWQVLLKITMPQGLAVCGGSLISEQWVLTAGHCVHKATNFEVHLGGLSLRNDEEEGRVVVNSQVAFKHPKYFQLLVKNDIALIKLPQAVQLSDQIQPIALPSKADVSDSLEGRVAQVSGWGKTSDSAQGAAEELNYVDVNIISNKACSKVFGTLIIRDTVVCAKGSRRESSCSGDSGGPLVVDDKLVGVVSFGVSFGCSLGFPSGYTRVAPYLDWISEKTGIVVE